MTDSYIIIKNKVNDNDDENNVQNKDKKNKINKKNKKQTITTNKTLITDKTLPGEERKKNLFITSKLWKDYLV